MHDVNIKVKTKEKYLDISVQCTDCAQNGGKCSVAENIAIKLICFFKGIFV
jgi:hypothetical protein